MTEKSQSRIDRLKQRYRLWKYRRAVRGAERAKQKRIELERGDDGE